MLPSSLSPPRLITVVADDAWLVLLEELDVLLTVDSFGTQLAGGDEWNGSFVAEVNGNSPLMVDTVEDGCLPLFRLLCAFACLRAMDV